MFGCIIDENYTSSVFVVLHSEHEDNNEVSFSCSYLANALWRDHSVLFRNEEIEVGSVPLENSLTETFGLRDTKEQVIYITLIM